MTIIQTFILGIVEGISEFLPVSSTFHLIWTSQLLGMVQSDFVKLFQVFIQSGAILAVVFLYWKEILKSSALMKRLILSFIPTALVGYFLYGMIKGVFFENIQFTTTVFIVIGAVFLIVEYLIGRRIIKIKKEIAILTYRDAILVGLFQALAVIPGVSRAGAVLVGMMFLGYRRDESAKYSFMLSIPTILAASVFDFWEMKDIAMQDNGSILTLTIGTAVAFVSAYFGVSWLIRYLQNHSLSIFGWYRIAIGIILLLVLSMSP